MNGSQDSTDNHFTFREFVINSNSMTIHRRNQYLVATEVHKAKTDIDPQIRKEIFEFKTPKYKLQNAKINQNLKLRLSIAKMLSSFNMVSRAIEY